MAEPEPVITKEMALKAAVLFRNADPFSEDARGYAGVLVQFTEKSPDVMVKISPKTLPIFEDKNLSVQVRAILIGAFMAGNVDSQLLRGRKQSDSYAGDLQLIETYRLMQKKKPHLVIPGIEKLIDLESAGKLKAYLDSK